MSFFFLLRKCTIVSLGVLILSMLFIPAYAKTFPKPSGFVTDCCSFLTKEERQTIDDTLSKYQQTTSNQIAVAIVKNLEGDSVESYANELFRAWKIGEKTKNNGVLLLFSLDEKKIRIEVGYGLEGVLTDALSSQIIRNEITPAMKQKKYAEAITKGTDAIMKAAQGEYANSAGSLYNGKGDAEDSSSDTAGSILGTIIFLFFVFGNLISYVVAYMARSKSIWAGGIGGGVMGLAIMLFLGLGAGTVAVTIFLTVAGFILDAILSANYTTLKSQGKSTRFWDSGGGFFTSGGGSSSGGGGFGGFGGGSSGGGGASGGW